MDEFRGFVLVDDYAPIIFINGRDAKSAQAHTLVHALAHVVLGETGLIGSDTADVQATEQFCNEVAAKILSPLMSACKVEQSEEENTEDCAGTFYVTKKLALGTVFSDAIYLGLKTGDLMYTDAYKLTGMNSKTMDAYFRETGYAL